jgi:hypothetical protein
VLILLLALAGATYSLLRFDFPFSRLPGARQRKLIGALVLFGGDCAVCRIFWVVLRRRGGWLKALLGCCSGSGFVFGSRVALGVLVFGVCAGCGWTGV